MCENEKVNVVWRESLQKMEIVHELIPFFGSTCWTNGCGFLVTSGFLLPRKVDGLAELVAFAQI